MGLIFGPIIRWLWDHIIRPGGYLVIAIGGLLTMFSLFVWIFGRFQ